MDKKKLTHLMGIFLLVCFIWLPVSIEFSNGRIRATTETTEEFVDEPEEMEESQFVVRPQFSFSETQVMNQLNEVIQIKIISDLPTTEVTVKLPPEAKVEQEFFSGGAEMLQGEIEGQLLLRYPTETTEFDFSLSFDKPGEYPIAIVSEEDSESEMMIVVEEVVAVEGEEQVTEDTKVDEIAVLPEGDTNEYSSQENQLDEEAVHDFSENVRNEPNIYRGMSRIANGLPVNANLWIPGTTMINSYEHTPSKNNVTINGNRFSSGSHTLVRDDKIRVNGVGATRNGRSLDVIMTMVTVSNNNPTVITANTLSLVTNPGFVNLDINFEYVFSDDGSKLETPIYMSYFVAMNEYRLSMSRTEVYSALSNDTWNAASSTTSNAVFISGENLQGNINFITRNNFTLNYQATRGTRANWIDLFKQQGTGIEMSYSTSEVIGKTVEENFVSQYEINQNFSDFIDENFEMEIKVPEILQSEQPNILAIQDENGNDLDWINPSYIENKLVVKLSEVELRENLAGKSMRIILAYNIDKNRSPQTYFQDDGYLHIPLSVSTSYYPEPISENAKTWALPWGDAVTNEVPIGTLSSSLVPEKFVENLQNKLVGDKPFVVGIEEEKIFDTIGEDSINVIIESQISGIQNVIEVPIEVTELKYVTPVDPMNPETEVNPENKPILPENPSLVSIDFVSTFNFGEHPISAQDQIYYAKPQRLLDQEGAVLENGDRPNYIQISDRRIEADQDGWQLALRQEEQFTDGERELIGAQIHLKNTELVTAQQGLFPSFLVGEQALIPGETHILINASKGEGTGTWVYRFGNSNTKGESVALVVPRGATPTITDYHAILRWDLSAVPGN